MRGNAGFVDGCQACASGSPAPVVNDVPARKARQRACRVRASRRNLLNVSIPALLALDVGKTLRSEVDMWRSEAEFYVRKTSEKVSAAVDSLSWAPKPAAVTRDVVDPSLTQVRTRMHVCVRALNGPCQAMQGAGSSTVQPLLWPHTMQSSPRCGRNTLRCDH